MPDDSPTPTPITKKNAKKSNGLRDFLSFISVLAVAIGLAFLLITFVFRSYEVDGISMQTTLSNNDKLIIWKVPRTIARITGNPYIPKRGDVVIFDESNLSVCGQEGTRQLIKRVIGLPGDRVTIQNGHYKVYNHANPHGFNPDASLAYDSDHHIPATTGDINVTLSNNQLFVSGDNRPDSCDSRAFGPIQSSQLIGKLVLRVLPVTGMKLF